MPAVNQKSKADQLARARRNQHRCRERKRARVAELESQIDDLKAKIRQCEPCESPRPLEHEDELDTAIRENAARRDLLVALGFDVETQQRYIKSAEKRLAVYAMVQGVQGSKSPSPSEGDCIAQSPVGPDARFDAGFTRMNADSAGLIRGNDRALGSFNTSPGIYDMANSREANASDISIGDLKASNTALDRTLIMDPFDDLSWLTNFHDSQDFAEGTTENLEPADSTLAPGNVSSCSSAGTRDDSHRASLASDVHSASSRSIECCFQDTVVQLQPDDTSTVCSRALALIFRYNRKGLSMAELQKRLRAGVRAPSESSGECRMDDSTLFKVLADIST